jgi:hypothetical protein
VQAWAKLIGEMWRGNSQVVRPDLFKRILGQYNVTFEGRLSSVEQPDEILKKYKRLEDFRIVQTVSIYNLIII